MRTYLMHTLLVVTILVHGSVENVRAESASLAIWKPQGLGLDISQVEIPSKIFFKSHLTLLRFGLADYKIVVIRATDFGLTRATIKTLCQKARALACINANFFDEGGKPLGLVVTRGMTLQGLHRRGGTLTGVFQITRNSASIINRSEYNPEAVVEAIQAGPRLLAKSEKIPGLRESNSSTRRSGVCIDASNRIILYVMSTGFFGLSLENLREFLLSDSVQCTDAINLDGGGSAQLYAELMVDRDNGSKTIFSVEGTDEIPIAL